VPLKRALCWLRSGERRLRRDRVIVVVGHVLTADHDRISPPGVVASPAEDAGADAPKKINLAASDVATPTADGRRVIEGGVVFATTDAGVGTVGVVACAAANAGAEAEVAPAEKSCDVALAAADAGIG
jgi:hypothetical protein